MVILRYVVVEYQILLPVEDGLLREIVFEIEGYSRQLFIFYFIITQYEYCSSFSIL